MVNELQNIMPIENVASVMEHGILSFARVTKLPHSSVAMADIQDKRDKKKVPGGLALHQYANLYFHARNPMMFKRRNHAPDLCVLRVSIDVIHLDGVVLTDQNAASDYVRFLSSDQIDIIDFDKVYAEDWRHPGDPIAYYRHKSIKCAEVLVPDSIDAIHIDGAYVCNDHAKTKLQGLGFESPIEVCADLFFV